jgi:site-specific recombinase XerD
MKDVRGLSQGTRQNRHRDARRFLQWRFGNRPLQLRQLQPKDVSGYVLARARHLRATALHPLCANLRSFLRFLEFSGRLRRGLVGRVPQLPQRAAPVLPRLLEPQERQAFLNSFVRSTPRGRRDYAIALCLSDLALRGHEVASLTLDDLDWRALRMRLAQTKQRRERLVPLPDRVARALLDYLKRGRPPTQNRALFVHLHVPRGRPLAAHYVRKIVRRAFARCGIQVPGTHVLRHTWATWAHRRGANLKLIADVLGHRSLQATAGYAHVHTEELRRVALPWPRSKR